MTDTTTERLAGTAHGAVSEDHVFLTRRVRIPRADILAVQPSRDGQGATVITKRGAMRVCEDFTTLMYHLYGANVAQTGGAA